jgi:hypothetical protein
MMLISKRALDEVADYYLTNQHEKTYFGMPEEKSEQIIKRKKEIFEGNANGWWFEFLKHPFGDGEYGEDISFCFKAKQRGIDVYVDTTIRPEHMGDYGYTLDDFVQQRTFREAEIKAETVVVE